MNIQAGYEINKHPTSKYSIGLRKIDKRFELDRTMFFPRNANIKGELIKVNILV